MKKFINLFIIIDVIKNVLSILIMNKQDVLEKFLMAFMQMILRQELLINVWKNAKNVIQKVSVKINVLLAIMEIISL